MKLGKHKRWLSVALVICMVLAMNISALAASEETEAETETVVEMEQETDEGISTVNEIETYDEIDPDVNYILVGKTFEGITSDQIPGEFQIQVTNKANPNTTYTLNSGNTISKSTDGLTWQWKIDNAEAGSYSVTEIGAEVPGYDLATIGIGDITVTAAKFDVTKKEETTCSHTNWPVKIDGDQNFLFAAALTGNAGCVVISKTSLTASQRITVKNAILGGNWKETVYFYSIDKNGNGPYTVQGRELHYDPVKGEVVLKDTSNWSHVATLSYSMTAAGNPDISIKNTYTPSKTSVDIQKLITGSMGDRTEEFSFTVTCTEPMEEGDGYTLSEDKMTATFPLGHEDHITLNGVKMGSTLTISESGAADYDMTIQVGGTTLEGNSYTIPLGTTGPISIVVTNNREGAPDTGITLDSLPYILILAVAAAGVVVVLMKKRRRHNGN